MLDHEVKALLKQILDILPTLATKADIARVDAKVDRVDAKVGHVDAKVDRVDAKVGHIDAKVGHLDAKVDAMAVDLAVVKADVAELKTGQAIILDHLDVAELKGRVEEQSRTIARLIPTRVAAVPGR
ncbi:hypothetical protein WCLP8_3920002 [uncultured Gammaproteobacteria bacterium]